MLSILVRPRGRCVDLRSARRDDFARSCRREDEKLQGAGGNASVHAQRRDEIGQFIVGKRRDRSRPQDVLAFTIYPDSGDIRGIVTELERLFPADFKRTRVIPEGTIRWFREGNAFHLCVVLDKHASLLFRKGRDRRDLAQASIAETFAHVVRAGAPAWIVKRFRDFKYFSRPRNFNMNLYNDVLVLSFVYAFVVGLIAREGNIDRVRWCSDRDDRTNWGKRILDTYGLVNACRWASEFGQRFDAAQFPSLVLCAKGRDPFDALIRPSDYLAGSIASWDLTRGAGTQRAEKYRQMLREAVADNPNIAILHLRLDHQIHATRLQVEQAPRTPP